MVQRSDSIATNPCCTEGLAGAYWYLLEFVRLLHAYLGNKETLAFYRHMRFDYIEMLISLRSTRISLASLLASQFAKYALAMRLVYSVELF